MSIRTPKAPSQNTRPSPKTPAGPSLNAARRHTGAAAVAATSGLTAALLTASFVIWTNQYQPVVYNTDETSTTPHFATGFIATGVLDAAALVLAATTAIVAGLITMTNERIHQVGVLPRLLTVTAAALIAAAIPIGILHPFLAIVPLFFAAVATVLTRRKEP
jgi:hypothetical protein